MQLDQQQRFAKLGGARRVRTDDLLRARQALSQLSYGPLTCLFFVWRRCSLRSVGHASIHSLSPSLSLRLASQKKSCASLLFGMSRVHLSAFFLIRVQIRSGRLIVDAA